MATMITEVYEAFKDANVEEEKAIAAATAIPNMENLATKEDLLNVRNDLNIEIGKVRQDLIKQEARLTERINNLENRLTIRLGGMLALAIVIMIAVMKLL